MVWPGLVGCEVSLGRSVDAVDEKESRLEDFDAEVLLDLSLDDLLDDADEGFKSLESEGMSTTRASSVSEKT